MARTLPSGKRSRSVPSGSIPSKRPRTMVECDPCTLSSVPMAWARASHALAKSSGGVVRHSATIRLIEAARSGAKASGAIRPLRCAAVRPSICGAAARLTPNPMTTRSPCLSSKIPATFAPSRSRSFGHFRTSRWPGTAASSASMRARPATRDSDCAGGSLAVIETSVLPKKLPLFVSHWRPWRPFPAVCSSATSQSPSAAP